MILAISTLGMLASIPGQTMGVSVFTDPLMAATALSRMELSTAYLFGTLASGLGLPFAGAFLDRYGTRLTVVCATWLLAATLVYLASIDRVIASLASGPSRGGIAFVLVVVGFASLRFSGQGVLTLVSRQLIGHWFERLRGVVAGISQPFVSFGFATAPLGLALWIDASGWRGAWLEMALVIGTGMALLGWLVYRDRPEDCGLRMDGRDANADVARDEDAVPERAWTRSQALRTPAFWVVTFGLASQGLTGTGVTFHIVDLGVENGLSRAEAVSLFPFNSIVSVVTSVIVGWLTRRVRVQTLLIVMLAFQAVGMSSVAHFGDPAFFWLAVAGIGVSGGFWAPLSAVVMPGFFGRAHLGAINSAMMMWIVWASAVGPAVLALSRDWTGSYVTALYACATLPLIALVLTLFTPTPPQEPDVRAARSGDPVG